ncbi:MAG: phosphate-starvation-inducible PsiE family protein, partial [Deltaproteobacteria bacterium]|nr:phosphate-starvation-inducible PsiE family protein [Deltaproteobacteria bacterium]
WMMIELLHTQVENLRGGRFRVQVFVELALVAFIRKLFVAAIDEKEAVTFALLIGGLFVLGVVFYLVSRVEPRPRRS